MKQIGVLDVGEVQSFHLHLYLKYLVMETKSMVKIRI